MIVEVQFWRYRKDGTRQPVPIRGLRPEALAALDEAREVWYTLGLTVLRVTSTTDGEHSPGSFHYLGLALDLGRPAHPEAAVKQLRQRLGKEYQVIEESDHIHVEYDPRRVRYTYPELRVA